ncbi:MAG: hypothetical protein AAGA87_06020 [Pseudomonadota bacterium]
MTGRKTLERRLEALASVGVSKASGRTARSLGPDTLLRRLLIELDMTIMPRRFTVETDLGRAASLLVANGRLIRIENMVGGGDDVGVELKPNDTDLNARLETQFRALLEGAKEMTTLTVPPKDTVDSQAAGPSAHALAQAWGIALERSDRTSAEIVDAFLDEVKGQVVAALKVGGEGTGDSDKLEELTAFVEARSELEGAEADQTPWSFLSLRRASTASDITVSARHGDATVYLSVPRERLTKIADAWRIAVLG